MDLQISEAGFWGWVNLGLGHGGNKVKGVCGSGLHDGW